MTLSLGTVPAGTTIYIPFATYDGATGASEACSGLAVTDIEIYKNGSTTQRASDAGYTLLDTDGIDFDSLTGINGFSIDLSDNTDAGFYAVGSWYWVVVSSITADAQTVNFIAAVFRIGPAESVAGYPKADAQYIEGVDATNQINTEVDTALSDIKLDHLVAVAESDDPVDNSILAKLVSKDATADWSDYNNTTDSLEANRDNIGTAGAGLTIAAVTGAVGSVTGAVGSVTSPVTAGTVTDKTGYSITGTLTTLDALWAKIQKWLRLALRKDAGVATDHATELTEINANGGSGAGAFANTTDSQEALRDRGDAAWITATGFSTLVVQDVRDAMKLAPTAGDPAAGSVDKHLDDIMEDIGTPVALDSGTATLAGMLTKMADDSGGSDFDAGTDSLAKLNDDLDAIKLKTDLLETGSVSVVAPISGTALTITAGATYTATVSGLTIPSTWTKCWFTLKRATSQTDAQSLVQIVKSNPADGTGDGLLYLEGVSATKANGSLVVTPASGSVAITIADDATATLAARTGLVYDIKALTSAGTTSVLTSGTATISLTPTRSIS